jgi:hypothetical protein
VWFVTYHDHPDDNDGMSVVGVDNSLAIDGPGPPIPAQSPELFSHSGSPVGGREAGPAAAEAAGRENSTADLMFGLPDSLAAGNDSTMAAAAAASGAAAQAPSAAVAAAVGGSSSPRVPASGPFARIELHRSSSTGPAGGTHNLSSSLIRAQFRPFVRTPTLRLSRPQHSSNLGQIGSGQIGPGLVQVGSGGLGQVGSGSVPGPHFPVHKLAQGVVGGPITGDAEAAAAPSAPASGGSPHRISTSPFDNSFSSQGQGPQQQQQQLQGLSSKRAQAAARSKAYLRSVSVPDPAAATAAVALLKQQQQEQQQQQEGSPATTAMHPAASPQHEQEEWQQWQQSAEGLGVGWGSGGGLGEGEMSTVLAALNDPETMSFVKLVSVCEGCVAAGWLGGLRLERG